MIMTDDEKYMKLALELADKGRGKTSPNPMVGAVIVNNRRIVGRGYHHQAGTPHAEIHALKEAGKRARGAILYVNLEPCCHHGRTKPCTTEIIKAGISEVVYSIADPNPLVNGRGRRKLREFGIRVRSGILRQDAENLNEAYFKFIKTGLPFVILKTAQSIDGRIATITGDSKWITCPAARRYAHGLRSQVDAVVVGTGTVLKDDPQLTVRLTTGKNPYRIVMSRSLNFPPQAKIVQNNTDARTIIATGRKSQYNIKGENLIIWRLRENREGLSLKDFLKQAAAFGITSILIEAGPRLATSFIKENLVDKHYIFMAPRMIGKGLESIGDLKIRRAARSLVYKKLSYVKNLDSDVLLIGYPEK